MPRSSPQETGPHVLRLHAAARALQRWGPIFSSLDEAAILRQAAQQQERAQAGQVLPLHGLAVSVKDLFDVEGERTLAGSVTRVDVPCAGTDAAAVQRLRAQGALIFGRTTMSEFAYSGLGLNPHTGTPLNPAYAGAAHIPGGSSSGAAVSVACGVVDAALCSDTAGSARIPAALCGLVGVKPTQDAITRQGMLPLARELDSVGVIARDVATATRVLYALFDARLPSPDAPRLRSLHIAVIDSLFFDGIEDPVRDAFESALLVLRGHGAFVSRLPLTGMQDVLDLTARGGFQAAQAHAAHAEELARTDCRIDPRIAQRMRRGRSLSRSDILRLHGARQRCIDAFWPQVRGADVIAVPTVPIRAPRLQLLDDESSYFRLNQLLLRNPGVVNLLDGCAISLPLPGAAGPCGLMLIGRRHADQALLAAAAAVEGALQGAPARLA